MKNIDDIFQQRLYDTEVAPPPFVWPNVERELRRRRRRAFFWWSFGGLLLAAGLWQFGVSSGRWAAQSGQPTADFAQQKPSVPPPSAVGPQLAAGDEQRTGSAPQNTEQPAGDSGLSDFSQKQEARDEGRGVRGERREVRPAYVPSVGNEGRHPDFSDKKSTANTSRSAKTGVEEAADKSEDQQVETAFVRASGGAAALPPSDVRASTAADPVAAVPTNLPASDVLTAKGASPNTASSPLLATTLPPMGYSLLAAKLPLAAKPFPHARANTRKKTSKYKNCYDFNSHPNVFLVDVYAGPSLARKDLRPASPEESWYRQRRLATESSDWAFNAGVRGTLLLNQHFLIRSGLHYDQIVEKFEYADPNYKEVNIRQRSVLVNGVWQTVSDTSVSYGEHYTKTYNRFGMLDIPLQVGLEVRNRRSGVSLQAGASINVLFWKRGDILSMTEQPASFAPGDGAEVFRPRTGLSVSGSVQWFYHLKPRLRVFAEPYFRQVLRPITLDGHPVEQRYGIGGLRLGLTKIMD